MYLVRVYTVEDSIIEMKENHFSGATLSREKIRLSKGKEKNSSWVRYPKLPLMFAIWGSLLLEKDNGGRTVEKMMPRADGQELIRKKHVSLKRSQ